LKIINTNVKGSKNYEGSSTYVKAG
jgi:hypothetical protein